MGDDDANVGGPGECPGHLFEMTQLVMVKQPGRLFPGLAQELECVYCGAIDYQASVIEKPTA